MKTITHPRATKVGVLLTLQPVHAGLGANGRQVKHRVGVVVAGSNSSKMSDDESETAWNFNDFFEFAE